MNPDSAPGAYGFGGHCFHACWDFVGLEVSLAVQDIFKTNYILPNLNSCFVALIP